MNQSITHPRSGFALCFPCTTAAWIAWYLRSWHTPRQRIETISLTGIVLAGAFILIWLVDLSYPAKTRWLLPEKARFSLGILAFIGGMGAGYRIYRRISTWLDGHWLAWCLSTRKKTCEIFLHGFWNAGVSIAKLLLLSVGLWYFFELHVFDILAAAGIFSAGYALSFFTLHFHRGGRILFSENNKAISKKRLPCAVLMQMPRPRFLFSVLMLAVLAVSMVCVISIQTQHPGALVVATAIAAVGFIVIQSLMVPGAAVLRDFLGWTGISAWRGARRLMAIPVVIALLLACPVMLSAWMLQTWGWAVIGMIGVASAGYAALIWIVHDLIRSHHRRSNALIMLLQLAIPPLTLVLVGPAGMLVICMHLGWLMWRMVQLWKYQT